MGPPSCIHTPPPSPCVCSDNRHRPMHVPAAPLLALTPPARLPLHAPAQLLGQPWRPRPGCPLPRCPSCSSQAPRPWAGLPAVMGALTLLAGDASGQTSLSYRPHPLFLGHCCPCCCPPAQMPSAFCLCSDALFSANGP